jgi:hypothetical protein
MLEQTMLNTQEAGGRPSLQSMLADKNLPQQLRVALTSLHQATASLIGSDGHRRMLQKEGVAYTLRFGPPLMFQTPNLADNKQPLLLLVQGEEFSFDADTEVSFREMTQRVARDPVGQAVIFELMIRLFFVHVLGVREETIGWRRGDVRRTAKHWCSDGLAADFTAPWSFGPVAAAFGPVEAQGRGSLHPHILIWFLLAHLSDLLDLLMRDKDSFRERVRQWMKQVIAAAMATQETAVTEIPRSMQGGTNRADIQVPPLPFGPNERSKTRADGEAETAAAAEGGDEEATED